MADLNPLLFNHHKMRAQQVFTRSHDFSFSVACKWVYLSYDPYER